MFYSYVMGMDKSIYELEQRGFIIKQDGSNYMISFEASKAQEWEEFICHHLELEYWNEYLTDNGAIFIFHLEEGYKRYVAEQYLNDEVLHLCEKLCDCRFESIKRMLKNNHFYGDKIN